MIPKEIEKIAIEFSDICVTGMTTRWEQLPIELSISEAYEVVGALMARQATLAVELALTPSIWNGHTAPLILRSMTDAHITLAWILGDFETRAKEYISYGIGQAKLSVEHHLADESSEDDFIREMVEMKKEWINSQRADWAVEVNVGSWSGASTRKMAMESDCIGLYNFAYVPFSAVAHNMWNHVSIYNLKQCSNPLHKFHKVPTIHEVPIDVDYVYRASKYVSRTFVVVDEHFNLSVKLESPVEFMDKKLSEYFSSR